MTYCFKKQEKFAQKIHARMEEFAEKIEVQNTNAFAKKDI